MSPEQFWDDAERNLRERKVRLLFVADRIPKELKRLVEFLNEELERVEVLAMNIRQFRIDGDTRSLLAPELVGATARAEAVKDRPLRARLMDEEVFFARVAEVRAFYLDLLERFTASGGRLRFAVNGISLQLANSASGKFVMVAYCLTDYLQFYFDGLSGQPGLREQLIADSGGVFAAGEKSAAKVYHTQISETNRGVLADAFVKPVDTLKASV